MIRRPSSCGFSLLETMIALGLIGVLIGTIGLFVNQIAQGRDQMRTTAAREALATGLFDALEAALTTSIARSGTGSAGMVGTSRTLTITFDGVVVSRVFGLTPRSVLDPETTLDLRFDEGSGRARLLRDGSSNSSSEPSLGAVRMRYLADGAWSESWDSLDRGGLPSAVECSIWWVSPFADDLSPQSSDLEGLPFESFEGETSLQDDLSDDGSSLPAPDRMRLMRVPDGGVSENSDSAAPDGIQFDQEFSADPSEGSEP